MERMSNAWGVGTGVYKGEMPVRRVRNSSEAGIRDDGRRWLNRARMGAWVGGIRRTRRPGEETVNPYRPDDW